VSQRNLSELQFGVEETSEGHPNYEVYAYHPEEGTVGEVQVTQHPGKVSFDYPIHVNPEWRRLGVGTRLMQTVKDHFPDHEIDPVSFTPEGEALFKSVGDK